MSTAGQLHDGCCRCGSARTKPRPSTRNACSAPLNWKDAKTGLEVSCKSIEYRDFPVVEWTLHFRNGGTAETPILEDIRALDVRIEKPPGGDFLLRGFRGDDCTPDSYQPYATPLHRDETLSFAPPGGRPTEVVFPYYNLEMPGGGWIMALGWPGQWSARFAREAESTAHVVAGQEQTHFKLLPGETARAP